MASPAAHASCALVAISLHLLAGGHYPRYSRYPREARSRLLRNIPPLRPCQQQQQQQHRTGQAATTICWTCPLHASAQKPSPWCEPGVLPEASQCILEQHFSADALTCIKAAAHGAGTILY